jgi:hypothetical protein
MTQAPATPKPTQTPPASPIAKPAAPQADPSKQGGAQISGAPFMISPLGAVDPWLKMLVYSKHGGGKTELVGSAVDCPQLNDVIMLASEPGEQTLQGNPNIQNAHKLSYVRCTSIKQASHIYDFLVAHCKARDSNDIAMLKKLEAYVTGTTPDKIEEPKRFKTVILDSLTEFEAMSIGAIMNYDEEKVMKDVENIDVSGWPEFRKNMEVMQLFCRRWRDLPMHVLFTAAESYSQDETKKYHYTPNLTGQLRQKVQGYMDLVGYLTVGTPTETVAAPRRLYIQPIASARAFDAKCRLQGLKMNHLDIPAGQGMETILRAAGRWKDSQ